MKSRYAAPWRASFLANLRAAGLSEVAAAKATQLVEQGIDSEVATQLADLRERVAGLEQPVAEKRRSSAIPAAATRDTFGRARPRDEDDDPAATKSRRDSSGRRTPYGTRIG